MKTIKRETYKNHNIYIKAKYKEVCEAPEARATSATTSWSTGSTFKAIALEKEVVEIELEVFKDRGNSIVIGIAKAVYTDYVVIKEIKGNKEILHEKLVKEIDRLCTKAKELVDQIVREEEITGGLPNSLLKDDKREETQEENDAVTNIFNVFIQAIESVDTKDVDSFMKKINEQLKRNKGMR